MAIKCKFSKTFLKALKEEGLVLDGDMMRPDGPVDTSKGWLVYQHINFAMSVDPQDIPRILACPDHLGLFYANRPSTRNMMLALFRARLKANL